MHVFPKTTYRSTVFLGIAVVLSAVAPGCTPPLYVANGAQPGLHEAQGDVKTGMRFSTYALEAKASAALTDRVGLLAGASLYDERLFRGRGPTGTFREEVFAEAGLGRYGRFALPGRMPALRWAAYGGYGWGHARVADGNGGAFDLGPTLRASGPFQRVFAQGSLGGRAKESLDLALSVRAAWVHFYDLRVRRPYDAPAARGASGTGFFGEAALTSTRRWASAPLETVVQVGLTVPLPGSPWRSVREGYRRPPAAPLLYQRLTVSLGVRLSLSGVFGP